MKHNSKNQPQLFWPRVVLRKWLNISAKESDYSADTEDDEDVNSSDSETEAECNRGRESRFKVDNRDEPLVDANDGLPRLRRRNSETFRMQYINAKDLRICVATWNVGGKLPPEDLDIDGWIDTSEPADIYVLGLQEIVPLNAGNIFGAEDSRPVARWEDIIRETLNRVRPATTKIKCFSDPPSPSKFKPSDDIPDLEEEILQESDSDVGVEVHPCDEEFYGKENGDGLVADKNLSWKFPISDLSANTIPEIPVEQDLVRQYSSPKRLDRLNCFTENEEAVFQQNRRLTKMLSGTERIGLSWPEPPLHLLPHHVSERPNSFKSMNSFKTTKSFRTYSSFKSTMNEMPSGVALLGEIDLESLLKQKRRSSYIRIVSKQMVGVFLTVWVRRSLRRHIQNVNVSTVGVGVMGYIGNKGSISVSMSIYQTLFCFICTHLTSGEKDGDELKRNADVSEIHRRTQFHPLNGIGFPKVIHDHERIIWLGDLNYRINLLYEKTRDLISRKEWSKLAESDQLSREFKKGRAFDGWTEGNLNFPPTYKYEINSEKYYGEDPKVGRRTPAWCDRILSYGKGLKLCSYRRTEIKFSDHRPVTATYVAEVEVFCPRKLQRALTFTDAEIENGEAALDAKNFI
ncbi:type IV inositol polyphosphate 5-phosphatase 3 isoform X1 [Cucurbita maxima]|uniref:Type IV inositol polyphosphate 5-phosphatase 3 isoform X1 n=1 Tax=Cucurbita maxima TaxID=3661 RepID=A0A6J1JI82_CUCMA|nr:type IV inositol polyphosphate 5-phosphatase 3 isoform X1 [Cucurbita maxima]XP_022990277.1 type IV inositol polyphosphate 5-phosphatase 3 isoform X1 [Cucurbita maxima]